jgi:hypothetical protein
MTAWMRSGSGSNRDIEGQANPSGAAALRGQPTAKMPSQESVPIGTAECKPARVRLKSCPAMPSRLVLPPVLDSVRCKQKLGPRLPTHVRLEGPIGLGRAHGPKIRYCSVKIHAREPSTNRSDRLRPGDLSLNASDRN